MSVNINALWRLRGYRTHLFNSVRQDIRQRYVGSIFGVFWAILYPAAQLSIYAILYVVVFKVKPPGLDEWGYVLLVFSGLIPLMAFNEMLIASASSLTVNKNLLLNTVFPAELIPIRAILSAQIPSLCGLIITLVLATFLGRITFKFLFWVPIFWILLIMFAAGIGWITSLLGLVMKDLQQGIGLLTMLITMLSPFAYTPDMVPQLLKPIIYLNPLSYFVLSFQQVIAYQEAPDCIFTVATFLLGLGSLYVGFRIFQKAKAIFFDYA